LHDRFHSKSVRLAKFRASQLSVKKCSYCGRENADDADYCYECGTAFHPERETRRSEKAGTLFRFVGRPISPWVKWGLYFAAWGAVVLAAINRNNAHLLAILAFPTGLLSIMPFNIAAMAVLLIGWVVVFVGWTIYIVLTIAIGRTKRVSVFSLLYVLFCILLAVNVAGCKKLLETAAGIH